MKKQTLIICASMAIMALSCSKSKEAKVQPMDYIKINTMINGGAEGSGTALQPGMASRAVASDQVALSDIQFLRQNSANVALSTFNFTDFQAVSGNRAAGVNSSISFPSPMKYDKVTNLYTYLVGYYPKTTVTTNIATWAIDGTTDVLLSKPYKAGRYSDPIVGNMEFDHVLAQLQVVCKAPSGVSQAVSNSVWGKIKAISVKGASKAITYNYANNTIATAAAVSTDLTALLKGETYKDPFAPIDVPTQNNTAITAAAMIPAQASPKVTLTLEFEGGIVTAPIEVPVTLKDGAADGNLTAGFAHTITLTLDAKTKAITTESTTIKPWGAGFDNSASAFISPATIMISMAPFDKYDETMMDPDTGMPNFVSYNELFGQNTADNKTNGEYQTDPATVFGGERPYYKFTVDSKDIYIGDDPLKSWTVLRGATIDNDICRATNGSMWRLPRISELALIFMNRAAFEAQDGFQPMANTPYWSATEWDATMAWFVDFGFDGLNGSPLNDGTNGQKTITTHRVRCVKEFVSKSIFDVNNPLFQGQFNEMVTTNSYNDRHGEGETTNGAYIPDENVLQVLELAYYKFEVANQDQYDGSDPTKTWRELRSICQNKGDGWRMPRIVELMLIGMIGGAKDGIFLPPYIALDPTAMYWSATEVDADIAWSYDCANDEFNNTKAKLTTGYKVRCVKEVE